MREGVRPPPAQPGGMGERCKLPHRGLGRSPRSFASCALLKPEISLAHTNAVLENARITVRPRTEKKAKHIQYVNVVMDHVRCYLKYLCRSHISPVFKGNKFDAFKKLMTITF